MSNKLLTSSAQNNKVSSVIRVFSLSLDTALLEIKLLTIENNSNKNLISFLNCTLYFLRFNYMGLP